MVDSLMPTRWKLKAFLDEHGITVYKLAQHTGDKLSRNALYNLAKDEPPARIELKTLDVLIPVLSELTGKVVRVEDLLGYTVDS
jgi:DNA-binding Xre family transcriptional regulator